MSSFLRGITALLLTAVLNGFSAFYCSAMTTGIPEGCQNHRTLEDPWRNIGFISTSFSGGPKNDLQLDKGWYNFTGVGGDRVVHYCNISSVYSSRNSSSGLYECNAEYWNTGVMCAEHNISTKDCGGGLILYYLAPTSGLYASRHSSCINSSCGENAQCGFRYGSCECKPTYSVPDGYIPKGHSYGCTDFSFTQSQQCQNDITEGCLEDLLKQIQNTTAQVIPKPIITYTLEKLMNSSKVFQQVSDQSKLGNALLNATEKLVSALVRKTNTSYYENITLPFLEAEIYVVGPNASGKFPLLITTRASLDIDLIKISKINKGIDAVVFISYNGMSSLLNPESTNNASMISAVVTVKLLSTSSQTMTNPTDSGSNQPALSSISFSTTFDHTEVGGRPPTCMTWTGTKWVEGNCNCIQMNSKQTKCSCVHPGTFALIMQTSGSSETSSVVELLNTVAVAVGLMFLSMTLLTFALCHKKSRVINTALINLCLSLLLSQLLFLLTQKLLIYIQPEKLVCSAVAGVLHFLFLSAFVWMFIEAVLLFISVKNLTKIRSKQKEVLGWKCLIVIGYTVPLVIVGVSVGLFPEGYGSEQCWLKTEQGFFWSFLGPVCFILASNMLLFVIIGIIMISTVKKLNNEVLQTTSDSNLIRSVMSKTLLQFVAIGCSWILGFFTESSDAMKILFLILNSQQGTFIFFIHCVLNQEIRQQYKKILCCSWFSTKHAAPMSRNTSTISNTVTVKP